MLRSAVRLVLLTAFAAGALAIALRQGLVPARFSPLPILDLSERDPWFLDWRLAEVARDAEICRRVMVAPAVAASPVPDQPLRDGCGWVNAVRVSSLGQARVPIDKLRCDAAAALAMWLAHDVQPTAKAIFDQPVTHIAHMGGYACRNIIGSQFWKSFRSTHASANAIDISGFVLADGRRITVAKSWTSTGDEARFLRQVHGAACRYFRVVLGPDYNQAHHDHFHFDRGLLSRCI